MSMPVAVSELDLTDPSIWEEPLEGEEELWFERFRSYLAMPKPRRLLTLYKDDLAKTIQQAELTGSAIGRKKRLVKPSSPPGSWKTAFKEFHWEVRARACDRYKMRQQDADLREWELELRKKMKLAAEDNFRLADEMAKRALETKIKVTEKGEVLELPAHWTARDIAAFRVAAADIGAKAVRRPEVDLVQAVEVLIAEGILDTEVLDAAEQGYEQLRECLRKSIQKE